MSEPGEGLPKVGAPDQTEKVTPREIQGLIEAAVNERSVDFTFQLPALYLGRKDEEFTFDVPRGVSPSAIFEVKFPDFRETLKMEKQGRVSPPELITRVAADEDLVPEMRDLMKKRALEHNAARIEGFLAKGVDKSLLPQTDLLPPGQL